ncbi:DUF411 domain-containing protein [Mangrovicoccus sp. HB161399]|uniref:DUF411 domain-containing protein n=1 Tax=Mangrovicoccus sp. HB161399 TaxID=2720392 RepID=UPI00155497F4|nr:DUF411 domain-containing protein [Mangrovicoccus sp. HB161399]
MPDRRRFLAGALALFSARPALAAGSAIHVVKDPGCGCCSAWIAILEAEGFAVTAENRGAAALQQHKVQSGVPLEMASCHTAHAGGYFLEGHVPPREIRRLLAERPSGRGLAVPDMPWGSPGMGPEAEREAYNVYLVGTDGRAAVFAAYGAA